MVNLVPREVRFFATTSALRDWFDASQADADELWLGYHQKGSGMPSATWTEAVDEALCLGWIDGVLQWIDERSHAQRFTPHRKGSNWSAINVAKVATVTDDELGRFHAEPAAWSYWEARPASYRKATLHWVTSAKRAATRERRLAALTGDSKAERLVGPLSSPRMGV